MKPKMSPYAYGHMMYEKSNKIALARKGLCEHHYKKGECKHRKCTHTKWTKKK